MKLTSFSKLFFHKRVICITPAHPPVRRAENSWTHRHLCEFMGLDFEMAINQHYFEVLDVVEDLFDTVFNGLATQYGTLYFYCMQCI